MISPTDVQLPLRRVEHCMGTAFSFDIRSPGVSPQSFAAVQAWLHWVDNTFSTYRPDSQIIRLADGSITLDQCAPEVREVLDRCTALEAETAGYFSARAAGALDPSGLVKGWAIEQASRMLVERGSSNHCVNGGGDVQCVGRPEAGAQWRIGIAHPLRPSQLAGVAVGSHLAVATSGTAERGSHIVDPHTGAAPTALASVTIVGRDLATTDAYATAAFAMGTRAREWVETLDGFSALIVHADGTEWATHDGDDAATTDGERPRVLR